jgi:ATP-dependent DNA helicase
MTPLLMRITHPFCISFFDKRCFGAGNKQANQLDFLLSKASEYSNFIANDLQELQESMSKEAKKNLSSKKRKKDGTAKDSDKSIIFTQPKNLSRDCTLKDYQLEGVRWLASLFENGVSGILADEMGLGKTIQCVAVIAHLLTMGVSGPFLVVAPLATLPNWVREFEKWLPSQPVVRYHGPAPDRDRMLKTMLNPKLRRNPNFPVIVTSYEVAIRDQTKLEKLSEFTYVIVDEGHRYEGNRSTVWFVAVCPSPSLLIFC